MEASYAATLLPERWIPADGIGGNDDYLLDLSVGNGGRLALLFMNPDEDGFHVRYVNADGDASIASPDIAFAGTAFLKGVRLAQHPSGQATVCVHASELTGDSQSTTRLEAVRLDAEGQVLWTEPIATRVVDTASPFLSCTIIANGEDAVVMSDIANVEQRIYQVGATGESAVIGNQFPGCYPMEGPRAVDDDGVLWTLGGPGKACKFELATGQYLGAPDLTSPSSTWLAINRGLDGRAYGVANAPLGPPEEGTVLVPLDGGAAGLLVAGPSPFVDSFAGKRVSAVLFTDQGWTMPAPQYQPDGIALFHGASPGAEVERIDFLGPILLEAAAVGERELWVVGVLSPGSLTVGTTTLTHPGPATQSFFSALRFRDWNSVSAAQAGM